MPYLGDDLSANQPRCQQIADTYQQFFVLVCKPDSQATRYPESGLLEKVAGVTTRVLRPWHGRQAEMWT